MRINVNNLPSLKTFRTKLRKNLTPAEARFWTIVKKGQLEGRKFRRQHSVGAYVLDFYCPAERLGIELDGEVHFNERAMEHDRERRLFLEYFGIRILRFENRSVFDEPERVVETIYRNFGWKETTTPAAEPATPPLEGGELERVNL